MNKEQIIQILIYSHALFGGVALLSGFISLIVKKGKKTHKKSGKLFYYCMLLSALTALIIASVPQHESPFLFAIGIFSSYFIVTGYRALRFKNKNISLKTDKIISLVMIFTAILMILYNPIVHQKLNIVLTVLGIVGLIFSTRDLILYKNTDQLNKVWLKLHLGKMIGGYISATTAFVVVNNFFSSFYGWFVPGTIGGFYIIYWIKKLNKQQQAQIKLE
ncbi:DUF2306 domain-containing protein [Flavobacterium sp. SLB02]|uniref:DUF2306 domain-containing protein n=1 Tax=Flavobacterium sp. SLB02 TaxID=2665645 RepID=UPI0012A92E86|nr:DUF2306 domain-containing protein [Flavobacterium sp. SLB02]QGK72962.1 DUF2306 domain-containing protein [Flavobacterium sp. SLB02]